MGTPVVLTVDGQTEHVRTLRHDVSGLLVDMGLPLRPEDRVEPGPATALAPGLAVRVERARPVLISADGNLTRVYTRAASVGALLGQAGLVLYPHDEIWLDGRQVPVDEPLPAVVRETGPARFDRGRAWAGGQPREVRLSLRRAVALTVLDGTVPFTIFTTASTVGEALLREQMTLYLGDRIQPSLGSPTRAGMSVVIQRSKPILVTADGRTFYTRTRGKTVGDALVELGIVVAGNDRVTPPLARPAADNIQVRVVRVLENVEVQRQVIQFQSILAPNDDLEIDQQRLEQQGVNGEYRRRFKVVLEDGVEVSRTLTDDWVAAQPITQVVAYGRKITLRELQTPDGTLTYWRHLRMYATAYSAATSGTPRTAAYYGRTRLGWTMRKGIVAVDPTVILLGSQVYVPGYGVGAAGDTGGGIRSRMIDLGYDDDNLVPWHWWVDVYLLGPPPARSQIRWVVPNYPRF